MKNCQNHMIAVLIPCYNEELTVGSVIDCFRTLLPGAEIFVFDNCSSDNTVKVAREHGAIVHTVQRKGKGNVVRSMFDTIDADVYLMVDGDNTYLPEKIDQYIDPILCGDADMVVGDRFSATYFKENKRHFHGIGNIMVQRFVNMLFGVKLKDIMSGFRVFNQYCPK